MAQTDGAKLPGGARTARSV